MWSSLVSSFNRGADDLPALQVTLLAQAPNPKGKEMKRLMIGLTLVSMLTISAFAACYQTNIVVDPAAVALGDSVNTSATFTNCGVPSDTKRVLTQITATCACGSLPIYDVYLGETTLKAGSSIAISATFTPPCAGVWTISADLWTRNNVNLAHSETSLTVN
jgi:hypothetical protein